MPMDFDRLIPGTTYMREQLEHQWGCALHPPRFFNEHDGRVALFATRDNDGGGWHEGGWRNGLDVRAREFVAEVNAEREDINQRIRDVGRGGQVALFYRIRSPDAFTYKGLVRYVEDRGQPGALWLVLRLP